MSRQTTMTPSLNARQFKVFRTSLVKLERQYAQNAHNDPENFQYWSSRKQAILLVMHNLEEAIKK